MDTIKENILPASTQHTFCPLYFYLIVDYFGVKYFGNDNDEKLISSIEEHYTLTKDWSGEKYDGLIMTWDYVKREVHITLPGYVEE